MSIESDVRQLQAQREQDARRTDAARRRIVALRQAPERKRIDAELRKYPGLAEWLGSFDQAADPAMRTVFDRIRADAAQRQGPVTGPTLDERLRMGPR